MSEPSSNQSDPWIEGQRLAGGGSQAESNAKLGQRDLWREAYKIIDQSKLGVLSTANAAQY